MKNSVKHCAIFFFWPFHKAKHARPMCSYEEDITLLRGFGVNITQEKVVHASDNYSELCEKLKADKFWGVLFDGSEDITKMEHEIVYIVSVSSNGKFTSDFIGLISLGVNRMAQDITDGLVQLFHACGLEEEWKTKLVSVCTNGAAVNV